MKYNNTTDWRRYCEQEQLQFSCAIQSHGALLFVRRGDFRIIHVSANLQHFLPHAEQLSLGQVFGQLEDITQKALLALLPEQTLLQLLPGTGALPAVELVVTAVDGGWLMELEVAAAAPGPAARRLAEIYGALRHVRTVEALNELLTQSLQELTGFARVMIYRFDDEWNGEVIAEAAVPAIGSYLHLHFPASDIPAIARKLYEVNPWRYIQDAAAGKVAVLALDPLNPLDLTSAHLRSVSPMHVHYMLNMQVRASFSVAIRLFDKLWGLVVCHNPTAVHLPRSVRAVCYELVLKYRFCLSEIITRENISRLDNHHRFVRGFFQSLPAQIDSRQLAHELYTYYLTELQLSGVMVVHNEAMFLVGIDLPDNSVQALDRFLGQQQVGLWYTESSHNYIQDDSCIGVYAAGIAAINVRWIGVAERVVLFRAEKLQSVRWAGNPNKPVEVTLDGHLAISPRQSFETWVEDKRGQSVPWSKSDIALISHLQVHLLRSAE